ncbi:hypothetical protein ACEZCY_03355 [Streptacidiphilus sp. N1-12]|uniref:MarR family transcriptional regulator n=2 Tax=Streptacidiphilus alkalitolerans TaxID=3342712 RepID=A0ABV6V3N4_9ACTN
MTEAANSRLESVLAGIRDYLTGQLNELDDELAAARQAVAELSEELAAREAAVGILVAGRDLLVAKLDELDSATTESEVALEAVEAAEVAEAVAEAVEVAEAVSEAVDVAVVAEAVEIVSASVSASAPAPVSREALNPGQVAVLGFLEATPGVHKVAEISVEVNGPEASSAAVQAIRRALAVLTRAGLAAKSEQAGTAFYSATAAAPVVAPPAAEPVVEAAAPARKPRKAAAKKATAKPAKAAPAAKAARTAKSTKAAKPAKAAKAAKAAPAKKAPAKAAATVPAARTAPKAETVAAAKPVRADRAKIVATLEALREPQSAGEVSRAVMGDEWKSSDATNFRNVLKSMVKEGVVAEQTGEDKRARYTVPVKV